MTKEEAELIIHLSYSVGVEELVKLQGKSIRYEEIRQLGRNCRNSHGEFIEASGLIKGMKRISFITMLDEAKKVIEKDREGE